MSLGRDHRKFHVEPEHYDVVGAALLEALRTFAGEQWSIEYDQAWRDAYDVIASKMLAGAEADTNPAYWHAEVLTHERRGRDIAVITCRPLQTAGVPRRAVRQRRAPVPAAAVAHLLGGQRAPQGRHARVPRAGARRRLGVRRAGAPGAAPATCSGSPRRWAP